ncbi:hypothetical protein EI555_003645, partial [Monodon monoceros]
KVGDAVLGSDTFLWKLNSPTKKWNHTAGRDRRNDDCSDFIKEKIETFKVLTQLPQRITSVIKFPRREISKAEFTSNSLLTQDIRHVVLGTELIVHGDERVPTANILIERVFKGIKAPKPYSRELAYGKHISTSEREAVINDDFDSAFWALEKPNFKRTALSYLRASESKTLWKILLTTELTNVTEAPIEAQDYTIPQICFTTQYEENANTVICNADDSTNISMFKVCRNAKETIRLLKKTTEKTVDPRTSCLKTMMWYWAPNLITDFQVKVNSISFVACVVQLFCAHVFGCTVIFSLAVMDFDRHAYWNEKAKAVQKKKEKRSNSRRNQELMGNEIVIVDGMGRHINDWRKEARQ